MILFLKSSTSYDDRHKLSLREKLILIFKEKVEEADNDKDRAKAKRDLAKLQAAHGSFGFPFGFGRCRSFGFETPFCSRRTRLDGSGADLSGSALHLDSFRRRRRGLTSAYRAYFSLYEPV
jgi:hypothetical protein